MKKRFLAVFLIMAIIISSVPAFAYTIDTNSFDIPISRGTSMAEVEEMLKNSIKIQSSSSKPYEVVFLSEEELQETLKVYESNKNQRNLLPNLLSFTLTRYTYSVSVKITNIAVDSLDFIYGYIFLYDDQGSCGEASFNFANVPPLANRIVTCKSLYGPYNSGTIFIDATDGQSIGNKIWYF